METTRQNKIARLIQKELGDIFLLQTKAMHGVLVSVSTVRISPDLSVARAYLSIFPSERAEEIINDPGFEALRGEALSVLAKFMTGGAPAAFEAEEFVEKNKENADEVFSFWISYLRDILVLQCGAFERTVNTDKLSELRAVSSRFDEKKTVRAAELMIESREMLGRHVKASAAALRAALLISRL